MINDYNIANKYDLKWQTHSMLKCLNQNIIDEFIFERSSALSSNMLWSLKY